MLKQHSIRKILQRRGRHRNTKKKKKNDMLKQHSTKTILQQNRRHTRERDSTTSREKKTGPDQYSAQFTQKNTLQRTQPAEQIHTEQVITV
jgi:hypothetical protein